MNRINPLVSVIMPCYNQGQYLDEAVASVLAQTYQEFEIIVINDGSTDSATIDILQHYHNPRVQIIHTENSGPSVARNTGIERAQGTYILPLDADDKIAPIYLEKAVEVLEANPRVGIVHCLSEYFGARTGPCNFPEYKFPEILLGNVIVNSSVFRRADWETVGGYNKNMRHGLEDYDFWLSIIGLGREVVQLPETCYFYRQTPGSRNETAKENYFVSTYANLFRNHLELYVNNIEVLFQHFLTLDQTHEELTGRISDLYKDLGVAYEERNQMRGELMQEQNQVAVLQHQQQQLEAQIAGLEAQVAGLEAQVVIVQDHWKATQEQSEFYQSLVAAMETSKFWQIRNTWFNILKRLGLKSEATDVYTAQKAK